MTLVQALSDADPISSGGAPAWVLQLCRRLDECESVEAVMAAVAGSATAVLGCRQAWLIGVKPRLDGGPESAQRQLAQACVAARGAVVSAGGSGSGASPAWQSALAGLPEVRTDGPPRGNVTVSLYLPRGAGRHGAALVLAFDGRRAPDPDLLATCRTFAELADTAVAHQHAQDQVKSLLTALRTSREIGTAVGILMASRQVDAEEAFTLLREASQRAHRKLSAIAAEVVYTGVLAG